MKLLDIIKNSIKQAQQRKREAQYTSYGNDPIGALDMYCEMAQKRIDTTYIMNSLGG